MSAGTAEKVARKPKNQQETPEQPATAEPAAKPKSQLSWKERLALLPEDEARAVRAKAAEASRRSKAKKRGTTPEQAAVSRLEQKLARNQERTKALESERATIAAQLEAAKAALAGKEAAGA
jgi:hypothetical protein